MGTRLSSLPRHSLSAPLHERQTHHRSARGVAIGRGVGAADRVEHTVAGGRVGQADQRGLRPPGARFRGGGHPDGQFYILGGSARQARAGGGGHCGHRQDAQGDQRGVKSTGRPLGGVLYLYRQADGAEGGGRAASALRRFRLSGPLRGRIRSRLRRATAAVAFCGHLSRAARMRGRRAKPPSSFRSGQYPAPDRTPSYTTLVKAALRTVAWRASVSPCGVASRPRGARWSCASGWRREWQRRREDEY
eukprot:ctg_1132.g365